MKQYNDSFLNLLKYPLDKYQENALKAQRNAVIAAGAGSGKTQVLATRFAWLIMTKQAKVDEILTLTFTNKAASEMYQRIYETLYKYANTDVCINLTEEQKNLAKEALENFSTAHIQTLDSYCSAIVRQCANRYGIKPDFSTGSSEGKRDIKNKALVYLIQNMDSPAVYTYCKPGKIQDFAENTFAKIIIDYTSLATEKDYFKKKFAVQCNEIIKVWNSFIIGKKEGSISTLVEEINFNLEECNKKDDEKYTPYINLLKEIFKNKNSLTDTTPLSIQDFTQNEEKIKTCIELYEKFAKSTQKACVKKGYIEDVRTYVTALKNKVLNTFNSIVAFINQYKAIESFNILLDEFLEQINTSKRTSGNLTFSDVTELALKILLENEDIRNQEKNAYKKIMIDEFQDNNGKNRDLLYLLSIKKGEFEDNGKLQIIIPEEKTLHDLIILKDSNGNIIQDKRDENKLFFVGDEKQSIYKFRGADVSVFNELTSANENELIPMTYNYRSDPELLAGFNTIFENGHGIFENYTKSIQKQYYEAYYDKNAEKNFGKDNKTLPEISATNTRIHFAILDDKNYESLETNEIELLPKKDQLALYIAKTIANLEKEATTPSWSDYAILVKGRTDYPIITKYLNKMGVPYQIDVQKNIFSEAIVNDFYNFLRICVYPSDINAYSAYLCSPFVGLSANSVNTVLSHLLPSEQKTTDFIFDPFAPFDEQIKADISAESYEKYINGRNFFQKYKSQVLQQNLTTTLSTLWNDKGYKYETMFSMQSQLCAEHFDMLFELARHADENEKTVSFFIDQLDVLKTSFKSDDVDIEDDVSYPLERNSAIKIITIHKSKGLEFKHVFLYGCLEASAKSEKNSFFYDEKLGVSIKPEIGTANYFVERQKEKAKLMELAEFRRLIYVGITRAEKDIYIVGTQTHPKNSTNIFRLFENLIDNYYPYNSLDLSKITFSHDAGFDYIPITPIDYEELYKTNITQQTAKDKLSTDELRQKVLATVDSAYEDAKKIIYSCNPIPRSTPSSLEKDYSIPTSQDSDSGSKYENPEDILDNANFSAADFGTLVHSYLEMQANGIKVEQYDVPPKLFKNLTEKEILENKKICIQMCKEFAKSECGIALENAKQNGRFYRAEWAFRMFLDSTIFTGSIDLIYENSDGTYSIVDYKSDNQINAEKYIEQQKCYRTAASKMLKIPEEKISLSLYFLKHKQIVKLDNINYN